MRKIITSTLLASLTLFLVLIAADSASAQPPRWARNQTRASIDQTIKRLENAADRFARQLDRSLDNSRIDNTRTEDRIEDRAAQLENATDELRREFDRRGDTWWETRRNVTKCVTAARNLNRLMRDRRLNSLTRNSWARVQRELNLLAGYYRLPRV